MTNVGAQKIDDTILETYEMIVSTFSTSDKDDRDRFFKESFLLAEIKPDVVLGIPFLIMSNVDDDFQAQDLQWRSYTTRDVFLTNRQVKPIGKKEFIWAAFNLKYKAFIVYIAALSVDSGDEMHNLKKAQIAQLKVDEALIKVPSEHADFSDVFSLKLAAKHLEHMRINNYAIELVDDWQPPYSFIYSLRSVELEILKAYIKNNLVNSFIRPFNFPIRAPILFDKKPNTNLRLCVDYQGLNNLTIKN